VQTIRNQNFSAILKKFKGEFLARSNIISLNKWLLNTSSYLC